MLNSIYDTIDWDKDLPRRSRMIDLYTRVYEGTLYNHISRYFFQERHPGYGGGYIPLNQRQPSVKTRFCKIVTDNSVSLLFGSDHFPELVCEDDIREQLEAIIDEYRIKRLMTRAATIGSTGSVVIFVRVYDGVLRLEAKNTKNFFPVFDNVIEDKPVRLMERYKIKGTALIDQGYNNIEEPERLYWFRREWDQQSETYYLPYLCDDEDAEILIDEERSHDHGLGFVPAIWIRNLDRISDTDDEGAVIDGACTFEPAIDIGIEIDYQLSQAGRALKYSADPLLVLKLKDDQTTIDNNAIDATGAEGQKAFVRTANNALVLNDDDEAKLLEISGKASEAVLAYVRDLREYMIEVISGNRASADKVTAAQSGRALQAMNQSLIWLVGHLRHSYGDGLLKLMKMIVDISNVEGYTISVGGELVSKLNNKAKVTLKWPPYYPDTPSDRLQNASALKTLTDISVLSKETATKNISENYGIEDQDAELKRIDEDLQKINALTPKVTEFKTI